MSAPQTVLILPPLRPAALSRIVRLLGFEGFIVPQPGCLLLSTPSGNDAERGSVEARIAALSKALRRAELLQVGLTDGYLSLARWRRGSVVERPQPGLLAQNLPEPVLGLAHGSLEAASLPQARPIIRGGADDDDADENPGWFKRLLGR